MATPGGRPVPPLTPRPAGPGRAEPAPRPVADRLRDEAAEFDFFQAVRLLQDLDPGRARLGHGGPPAAEAVRLRARATFDFPASTVHELLPGEGPDAPPALTMNFFGLTGPSGVLPRHYTEAILRLDRERGDPERHAFRDWLDLFNHRLASLFYRAWEKYRLFLERDGARSRAGRPGVAAEPGPFKAGFLGLVGLGTPALRERLVDACGAEADPPASDGRPRPSPRRVDDATLIFYSGLLADRRRSAAGLEAILRHHFGVGVEVQQFQGRWLALDESNQSRLMTGVGSAQRLGANTVVGERVWDFQGFFRVRLGPLSYERFTEFLPDRAGGTGPRSAFLMARLVRFYVGPELDFDIALLLRAEEVPPCRLAAGPQPGPALGWNAWLANDPFEADADDAAFVNSDFGV